MSHSGLLFTPMGTGVNEKAGEDCVASQSGALCRGWEPALKKRRARIVWRHKVGHCAADGSWRPPKGKQGLSGVAQWVIVLRMGWRGVKANWYCFGVTKWGIVPQWELALTKRQARRVASQSGISSMPMGAGVDDKAREDCVAS